MSVPVPDVRPPRLPSVEEELEIDEGFCRVPYKDTKGIWTNGIGCNLKAHGLLGADGRPLSMDPWDDATIDQHLDQDVAEANQLIDKHIPWVRNMNETRQRVVLNMMFNMGWGTLRQFKNTLAAMEAGRYVDAARGMEQSLWAKQVGRRAVRLTKRMLTGRYFN